MPTVYYLPDEVEVEVEVGETILDVSRRANIPHIHACGGNARCSTCRVWILEGVENCAGRNKNERRLSEPLRFDRRLRLACQTVITGDVMLRRLILDTDDMEVAARQAGQRAGSVGEEKQVAVMFSDIRGFTPFSASLPAYDVIFVLNRYYYQMGQVIERHGGYVDNYMGDGLMAVFGVDSPGDAVMQAVRAGLEMLEVVENFKVYLESMYQKTFEIGIGVHFGRVVVGIIGTEDSSRSTAIGDAVNVASRVESANKAQGTRFLISEAAFEQVQGAVTVGKQVEAELKGKSGTHMLFEVTGLQGQAEVEAATSTQPVEVADGQRWVRVLDSDALRDGARQVVKVGDLKVLLVREGEQVFAMESACPHLRLPLKGGRLENCKDDSCVIVCPWHHSAFRLPDGKVRDWAPWPPGVGAVLGKLARKRKLVVYAARESDGGVWVALDEG